MIAFVYSNVHGDVAELADAQVSEACDGDIVEVQVLSSAPVLFALPIIPVVSAGSQRWRPVFLGCSKSLSQPKVCLRLLKNATELKGVVFSY